MTLAEFLTSNELTDYPEEYVIQHARVCDQILKREPGTTLKHLLEGADSRSTAENRRYFLRVLWLPASYDVFLGRPTQGFPRPPLPYAGDVTKQRGYEGMTFMEYWHHLRDTFQDGNYTDMVLPL
jgi:hypothetical protein